MYKLYLFDFDYTLALSERGILLCFRHVLNKYGYTAISDERLRQMIGYTLSDGFRKLTGVKEPEVINRYWNEYEEKAHQIMTDNTELYPDTIPTLKELKNSGAKVGIISSKHRSLVNEALEKYGAIDYVDLVIGLTDVTDAKPNPAGILYAIDTLDISKNETIYCGDSFIDAQAAQNAEVAFAAVTTGTTTKEQFTKYPCLKIMERLGQILEI